MKNYHTVINFNTNSISCHLLTGNTILNVLKIRKANHLYALFSILPLLQVKVLRVPCDHIFNLVPTIHRFVKNNSFTQTKISI